MFVNEDLPDLDGVDADELDVEEIDAEGADGADDDEGAEDEGDDEGVAGAGKQPLPPKTQVSRVIDLFGSVPDEAASDEALSRISDRTVERMDPASRGLVKTLVATIRAKEQELTDLRKSIGAETAKARADLEAERQQVVQQRARMAKVIQSDGLKKLLAEAGEIDEDEIDPLTSDGQRALAKKHAAAMFNEFVAPIAADAKQAAAAERYEALKIRYPAMKDKAFRAKVAERIKSASTSNERISAETAIQLEIGNQAAEARRRELAQRARARSESAARVGKATRAAGGQLDVEARVAEISKGYTKNGVTYSGAAARVEYFRDNPKAHARYRQIKGL